MPVNHRPLWGLGGIVTVTPPQSRVRLGGYKIPATAAVSEKAAMTGNGLVTGAALPEVPKI